MVRSEVSEIKSTTGLLITGFVVMISLVVLFASVSLQENSRIAELNDKIYHHPFSVSNAVLEANSDIIAMHRYMKDVVLATNQNELELAISLIEEHEQEVYRHFALIKERFLGDKKTVNTAFSVFVQWKTIRTEVIALQRSNQHKKAAAITLGKGAKHVQLLTEGMDVLIDFARNKALEFKSNSQKAYEDSVSYLYALLVFIVLSSLATAFFVVMRVRKAERARKESEERFEGLFKNAEVSIWSEDFSPVLLILNNLRMKGIVDLKKHLQQDPSLAWELAAKVKVNSVNDATLKLFGAKSKEEFMSKIDITFGLNAIDVFIEELCAIWEKQDAFHSEANFTTLDGKEISAIVSFQIPTKESGFLNIPVSIVDITDRINSEKLLQLSSRVFSDTHEGIMITDANSVIIDVNPSFTQITGYSRDETIGQYPNILSSGKQSAEFYTEMWQQIKELGHWQGEIWNRKKCGEVYAELLTISSLQDAKGNTCNYVGVFSDITNNKRQQDNIKKMAHYDVLTNLPNRALLIDRFNQALAHTKRSDTLLAVCFLDLDDFKPVNDTYGHDMGDKLLIEVAHRLKSAVRNEDTISRLGGDEFSLLLGDLKSTDQCLDALERIIKAVSATYIIDNQTITISASVGVSLCPLDDTELDVLLRYADQAMYQAKQEGKNHYRFFDVNEAQKIVQQQQQLQAVEYALLNHELCLFYQPKVNMVSGEIIGVEALIRWQHPEKGLIPPLDFLPLIEGTKLEIKVGDWVIEQGMAQLELLNEQDIDIEVSVNVSSNQFLSAPFFENLKAAFDRHPNIDSRYFQLEVLESSTLGNLEKINNIIKACRNELGVSIALDDFGTGYSSLSHLSKLPADTIKIDQGFVRDLLDDPNDFAIIEGVIGLANSFNKQIIAEGVETTEHGLMLILMGCNNSQGYAISRPMPANELFRWIKNYRPNKEWLKGCFEEMSLKGLKVKQLQLVLNHCLKNVESLLNNRAKKQGDMNYVYCHFDQWIKRLRKDLLFNEAWIDRLQQAYEVMCFVAKELVEKHQAGNIITKEELDKLYIAYKQLKVVFE